jgi:hypothetical protein
MPLLEGPSAGRAAVKAPTKKTKETN